MAVNLTKGGEVNLSKETPGLANVIVGLGWDPMVGADADLDASAFLLNSKGKVSVDADFVFYGNKFSADGAVEGAEDDRTGGASDGDDDEEIKIDLTKVSPGVSKIAITVTIHEAAARGLNFGMVENAYMRVVNASTGTEIVRYDLSGDFSNHDAILFGEFLRNGSAWTFRAIGEGKSGGLSNMCKTFGVNAG